MGLGKCFGEGACAPQKHSRFALAANLVRFRAVQSLATPQKPADTLLVSGRQFSVRLALPLLLFGALWFVLCRQLSGEWLVNEQYNYGWFVPFFALYLFWLRWQDRPTPEVRGQKLEVRSRYWQSAFLRFFSFCRFVFLKSQLRNGDRSDGSTRPRSLR